MAFCSAWTAKHFSCCVPLGMPSLSRIQYPLSRQLKMPDGAPLYPVVRIRLFFVMTAPTARPSRAQLVQPATVSASSINLLSHLSIATSAFLRRIANMISHARGEFNPACEKRAFTPARSRVLHRCVLRLARNFSARQSASLRYGGRIFARSCLRRFRHHSRHCRGFILSARQSASLRYGGRIFARSCLRRCRP